MALWVLQDASTQSGPGRTPAASTLVAITAGSSHAKGAWTELVASSVTAATSVIVHVSGPLLANNDTSTLLDIGIGAAASELVVIPDLGVGYHTNNPGQVRSFVLPVRIPAGQRISARAQSGSARTAYVGLTLVGGGTSEGGSRVAKYGVDAAGSRGTAITAPGSTHTKGAWTELVASTGGPCKWLALSAQINGTSVGGVVSGLIDIGVGASSSEVVILADIPYHATTGEQLNFAPVTVPVRLPAGVRLSARVQADVTSHTLSVHVHGID